MARFVRLLVVLLLSALGYCFDLSQISNLASNWITVNADSNGGPISDNDYIKNIFMRLIMMPSASSEIIHTICDDIEEKAKSEHLKDFNFTFPIINLTLHATNITAHNLVFDRDMEVGIIPLSFTEMDFVLPKLNISISFHYNFSINGEPQAHGNGTLFAEDLEYMIKLGNFQPEIEGKYFGRIWVQCYKSTLNFTELQGTFSDPYTQVFWDLLFKNGDSFKILFNSFVEYELNKLFEKVDLRKIINISFGKGINMLVGFSEMIMFPPTGRPKPDNRSVDMKVHSIVTLPSGAQVDGLFDTDMLAPMLSMNYSSLALNIDLFNKIIKTVSYSNSLNFSFNQRLFDLIHFGLLRLDTTSLKPFFPKLEPQFGPDKGVFMRVSIPNYDPLRSYVRISSGHTYTIQRLQLDLFVDEYLITDPRYYKTTLAACLENNECVEAVSITLDAYLTVPIQLTNNKSMIVGYPDVEVTHVYTFPPDYVDYNSFMEKLNNFLDLSIPHDVPPLNITKLIPRSQMSIDCLDDQRIIIGFSKRGNDTLP